MVKRILRLLRRALDGLRPFWRSFGLDGVEIDTVQAARSISRLRKTAATFWVLLGVLGGLWWLRWPEMRSQALGILLGRSQAELQLSAGVYDKAYRQAREEFVKVGEDQSIPDSTRVMVQEDLLRVAAAHLADRDGCLAQAKKFGDCRLALPRRIYPWTNWVDPLTQSSMNAMTPEAARRNVAVQRLLQDGPYGKLVRLSAIVSRPGAEPLPEPALWSTLEKHP